MKKYFTKERLKQRSYGDPERVREPHVPRIVGASTLLLVLIVVVFRSLEAVPPGHVEVGALFGKVRDEALPEGLHLVNPLMRWHGFDCRQKTHKVDDVPMPSNDQLITQIDWSIQYRADCSMAPAMLKNTGGLEQVVVVHLIPNFRSIIREAGKSVAEAEEYFSETVQARLQEEVGAELTNRVGPQGIVVSGILLRDVTLPAVIQAAIQMKKERQQAAERQEAELERFRVEQEQKVAQAQAELDAAKLDAEKVRTLAEAEAAANRLLAASLTNNLVEYRAIEKWTGTVPQVSGGAVPFVDLRQE